jgi:hypothetical protein
MSRSASNPPYIPADWLVEGDEVLYTSPYYPEIWVKGILGKDVFLRGINNSGHGMSWIGENHFRNEKGELRNLKPIVNGKAVDPYSIIYLEDGKQIS